MEKLKICKKKASNGEGEWTSAFSGDTKVKSELKKLTNSPGWVAASRKILSSDRSHASSGSSTPSNIPAKKGKRGRKKKDKSKDDKKKFKMVLEKDEEYEVDYVSPEDDYENMDDSDSESKQLSDNSDDDFSVGEEEEDDISSIDGSIEFEDEYSDYEMDEDVPALEYPESSRDLLIQNELVLPALGVYETLRHFRSLLRLSPILFEDFCAALVDEETNILLTECYQSVLKAIVREEDSAGTQFGPPDQKDSRDSIFFFLDNLTWPEVIRAYLESTREHDDVVEIVRNPKFPRVPVKDKIMVLKTLTDIYLASNKIRDKLMTDGVIQYDDNCRVCHKLGDLLCCETCPAVYHLACCDPPLTEVPDDEWQCEICAAHKLKGVYDCEPQNEFKGQYLRHEPVGVDRHGNKYWFLVRRLMIESADNVWYYSTQEQFDLVRAMLDPDKYEIVLCEALKDVAAEFPRYSQITYELTQDALPNDKTVMYLQSLKERVRRDVSEKRKHLEELEKKRQEDEKKRKEEEEKKRREEEEARKKEEEKLIQANNVKVEPTVSGETTNMEIDSTQAQKHAAEVEVTEKPDGTVVTNNKQEYLDSAFERQPELSSVPDENQTAGSIQKPATHTTTVVTATPTVVAPVSKTETPVVSTTTDPPKLPVATKSIITPILQQQGKNIQVIKIGNPNIPIKTTGTAGNTQLKTLFVLNKDGTKTQITLGPSGKIVPQTPGSQSSTGRQILVLNSAKVTLPKVNRELKKLEFSGAGPKTADVLASQVAAKNQVAALRPQQNPLPTTVVTPQPPLPKPVERRQLNHEEEAELHFRLGEDKGYREYVNLYTENTLALNKYQHKEERDRERYLSYKFSLSGAGEFKWIGETLGSESVMLDTLRNTLLHFEHQIPLCFMHTKWARYRNAWGKIVMSCNTPQAFAAALGILEMATRLVVKRSIWRVSHGLPRLKRVTTAEKEEWDKKRKQRTRAEEEESNRNAIWCKYPFPIKCTLVWKIRGEEFRMTGYGGWMWVANTRISKFKPVKRKPYIYVTKENTEKQEMKPEVPESTSEKLPPASDAESDSEKSASTTSTTTTKSADLAEEPEIFDSLVQEATDQSKPSTDMTSQPNSTVAAPINIKSEPMEIKQTEDEESFVTSSLNMEDACDEIINAHDVINISENLLKRTALYNKKWSASKVDILLGWRMVQNKQSGEATTTVNPDIKPNSPSNSVNPNTSIPSSKPQTTNNILNSPAPVETGTKEKAVKVENTFEAGPTIPPADKDSSDNMLSTDKDETCTGSSSDKKIDREETLKVSQSECTKPSCDNNGTDKISDKKIDNEETGQTEDVQPSFDKDSTDKMLSTNKETYNEETIETSQTELTKPSSDKDSISNEEILETSPSKHVKPSFDKDSTDNTLSIDKKTDNGETFNSSKMECMKPVVKVEKMDISNGSVTVPYNGHTNNDESNAKQTPDANDSESYKCSNSENNTIGDSQLEKIDDLSIKLEAKIDEKPPPDSVDEKIDLSSMSHINKLKEIDEIFKTVEEKITDPVNHDPAALKLDNSECNGIESHVTQMDCDVTDPTASSGQLKHSPRHSIGCSKDHKIKIEGSIHSAIESSKLSDTAMKQSSDEPKVLIEAITSNPPAEKTIISSQDSTETSDTITETTKTTISNGEQSVTVVQTCTTTVTMTTSVTMTISSTDDIIVSDPEPFVSDRPEVLVTLPRIEFKQGKATVVSVQQKTRVSRMSRARRILCRRPSTPIMDTQKVWKLQRYRKTSSTIKKEKAMKLPIPWKFCVGKQKKKSIFRLPAPVVRKLAVSGGQWSYRAGFTFGAKWFSGLEQFWSYPCPRPTFSLTWRYKLQNVTTFASVAYLLRIFWHTIKWEKMIMKPQTDDVVHTITTDEEIVTTELLKRKDNMITGLHSEYFVRKITMPILDPEEEALRAIKPAEGYTPSRKGLRNRKSLTLRDRPRKDSEPRVETIWVPEEQVELWQIRQFDTLLKQQTKLGQSTPSHKLSSGQTGSLIQSGANTFIATPSGGILPAIGRKTDSETASPGFSIVKLPLNQSAVQKAMPGLQPTQSFLGAKTVIGRTNPVQKFIVQSSAQQSYTAYKQVDRSSALIRSTPTSSTQYILQGGKLMKPIIIKAGSQIVATATQAANKFVDPNFKVQPQPQIPQVVKKSPTIAPKTSISQTQIKLSSSQLNQLLRAGSANPVKVSVSLGQGRTGIGQIQLMPPGSQVTPSSGQQLMQAKVGGELKRFLFTLISETAPVSTPTPPSPANEVSLRTASLSQRLQQIHRQQLLGRNQNVDMKRLMTDKDPLWGSRPQVPDRTQISSSSSSTVTPTATVTPDYDRPKKKQLSRLQREEGQRQNVVAQVMKSILDRIDKREEMEVKKKKKEEALIRQKERQEQIKVHSRQTQFLHKHRDLLKQDILKRKAIVEKFLTLAVKNELQEDQRKRRTSAFAKRPKKSQSNASHSSPVLKENTNKRITEKKQAIKRERTESPPPVPETKKRKMINTSQQKIKEEELYCTCKTPYDSTRFYIGCDLCLNWFHGSCVGIPESRAKHMSEWVCYDCQKAKEEPAQELYCICRTPYDDSKFYIGCDICQDWYHGSCVGVSEADADNIEFYACPKCKSKDQGKKEAIQENRLTQKDITELTKIINSLRGHKMSWPFLQPVSKAEVPNYYSIIKKPMDLGTVLSKLPSYTMLSELMGDVSLIFDNCRMFNGADSALAKCAEILESFFVGKMRQFRSKRKSV